MGEDNVVSVWEQLMQGKEVNEVIRKEWCVEGGH